MPPRKTAGTAAVFPVDAAESMESATSVTMQLRHHDRRGNPYQQRLPSVNSSDTLKMSSVVNNGILTNSASGHIVADTVTTSAGMTNAGILEGSILVRTAADLPSPAGRLFLPQLRQQWNAPRAEG